MAMEATMTRASTVTRSMATSKSRTQASMTMPLWSTRSRTSMTLTQKGAGRIARHRLRCLDGDPVSVAGRTPSGPHADIPAGPQGIHRLPGGLKLDADQDRQTRVTEGPPVGLGQENSDLFGEIALQA